MPRFEGGRFSLQTQKRKPKKKKDSSTTIWRLQIGKHSTVAYFDSNKINTISRHHGSMMTKRSFVTFCFLLSLNISTRYHFIFPPPSTMERAKPHKMISKKKNSICFAYLGCALDGIPRCTRLASRAIVSLPDRRPASGPLSTAAHWSSPIKARDLFEWK